MRKRVTQKQKIVLAFLLLLVLALISDFSKDGEIENGMIERTQIGGEEKSLQLQLEIEGAQDDYTYELEVLPVQPTKEDAEQYFEETIALISQDFEGKKTEVPLKKTYLDGVVKADWSFQPFGMIDSEGEIREEKLEEETTIQAQVELTCGEYERIHVFSFVLEPRSLSEIEQLLQEVDYWMEQQMTQEGNAQVQLPTKLGGKELDWSEEREYLTPQIFLLEVCAVILFWVASRRKQSEDEKKKLAEMERDYPDIVNQLSLLLGAGMTTRQAWNKLATQYSLKRKQGMIEERLVYEAIVRMNRRFAEGESERGIYQQFSEEIPALCYHKLMRILLGSLEKGAQGICIRLEEESRLAFEQRLLQAKKLGEEASTKMLVPLMLMMVIVMGIVMLPALIEFRI